MSTETNKEILRRGYEELFNNGNLQAAGELFGEDFYNHAGFPGWPRGPEHIRRAVTMLRTAFPDLHYTLEDVIAEGDTVAARWTARGTHRGEFRSPAGVIAPTGRQVTWRGVTYGRIVSGKASDTWVHWDLFGLLQQLRAIPAPAGV